MNIEEFRKLDKREVNKTIAKKLGFICDDKWEYNQNAMRDGEESKSWANLTLVKGDDYSRFSHIGWNPFTSCGDALGLIIDFGLILDLSLLTREEAREKIAFASYLECINEH